MALCAARSGVDALAYYETRTEGQFALDVMAWVSSWSVPASALLGKGKGGSGSAPRGIDRYPARDGRPQTIVDIDRLDRPETIDQLNAAFAESFPIARGRSGKKWEDKVRARAKKINVREEMKAGRTRRSG